MKKKDAFSFRLLAIAALAAVIGLSMMACGGGIPSGKYVHKSGMYYEISGNKIAEFFDDERPGPNTGIYKVEKDGIHLSITRGDGKVKREAFVLNGKALTIGGYPYIKL